MLLAEGYRVVGIDNLSSGTLKNVPDGVEFFEKDIQDNSITKLFNGCFAVYHLAAKNCLMDCMQNPLETVDVNVRGTVQVLESSRLAGVECFIYADTSAEYEGITTFPSPVDEVAPIGTYAVSKRSGWHFCESYRQLHGMNITTLRYFNVYGPAQDYRRVVPPVMSAFIMKMLAGERPIIYGTGKKERDFIYVDDVNRFHMLCLKDNQTIGNIYNVGIGQSYSITEIFERIEAKLKTGLDPIYEPDLPGEAQKTLADITQSQELGWSPKIGLDEGLTKSIDYIKSKVMTSTTI